MSRFRSDRGAITAMMLILSVALLALAGLVFDGSRIFAARRDANNLALQAARAGALHLDVDSAYGGTFQIDVPVADQAVRDFLAAVGIEPTELVVTPEVVQVTVHMDVETPMLAVLGIESRTVEASASAFAARGVSEQEN